MATSGFMTPKVSYGTKTAMTRWSRHDNVMIPHGNSDSWAKLKVRVEDIKQGGPEGTPGVVGKRGELKAGNPWPEGSNGDGRVSPRGHPCFSHVVSRDLHGAIPGNYTLVRPRSQSRGSLARSSFNERAKDGFKYWYQERPHPTKYGRYGMGSYKTVLGIGNAPRT